MKQLLYIFILLSFSVKFYAADDKNNGKETIKTILIKITDTNGEEIPGAKVILQETGKEYIADFNGNIQLNIKSNETFTVKIQSIGYSEKTIKSNELNTFNDLSLSQL